MQVATQAVEPHFDGAEAHPLAAAEDARSAGFCLSLAGDADADCAAEIDAVGAVVEATEAHRIGLLNHLVPCAQLREKTLELGTMIAKNRRPAVMGVKALLLEHMGKTLEEQWANERDYTTNVMRGAKAEDAFPEFIARKGR